MSIDPDSSEMCVSALYWCLLIYMDACTQWVLCVVCQGVHTIGAEYSTWVAAHRLCVQ